MTQISSRRMHTQAFMARAIRSAGQFAHVSVAEIEGTLADVYRERFRRPDYDERTPLFREAAHDHFVMAAAGKLCPRVYAAEGTINLFHDVYGRVCPLCSGIAHQHQKYPMCRKFNLFVSPSFLTVQPAREWEQGPLCPSCADTIEFWNEKHHRTKLFPAPEPQYWIQALTGLMTSTAFVKRLKKNRDTFRRLRLDPRKHARETHAMPDVRRLAS